MENRNTFCVFASLIWLLGSINELNAQSVSGYTFNSIASTYTYLSGGTNLDIIEADDAISGAIPIGFTFNYCGTNYTQLKASSNGWLTFNTAVSGYVRTNSAANLAVIKPALFPLWDDLSGSGGASTYSTTGTAPSRVFAIEYKNWRWDYSSGTAVISFQVKLFEGSNVIQFRYQRESGAVDTWDGASIGIADNATTPAYLSLNGAGSSPAASSTVFTTSISAKPSSGRVYQFTPPPLPCSTPAPGATVVSPSSSLCLGQSINLSISSVPATSGNTYQWQSSTDGSTYMNISGATTASYSTIPLTPTYYKCIVTCSTGPSSTASTPVFVNFANSAPSGTPAARCGAGTLNLAATGPSGVPLNWYTAPIDGTPLGTGSPFTTPVISTTTTYYVGAETSLSVTGVIGSGGTTSGGDGTSPFSQYYESNHSQYLVLASELSVAGFEPGNMTALSFNVSTKYSTKVFSRYTIKLAHTTSSSLSGLLSPAFTTVYGPATYTSAVGANTFSFASSFNWDGTSNVLIDVCFDNDPTGSGIFYSSNDVVSTTNKSYTAVYGRYADNAALCGTTSGGSGASSTRLPVITFTGNKICGSPRTAVTATINTVPAFTISGTQTVCNNEAAPLSVTSPLANYTSYTWSPATGLFTDAACMVPYVSGTSTSTVHAKTASAGSVTYRCDAHNSSSLCNAFANVTVTTLPASVTATASPAFICVSGSATLTLSPSPSGFGAATYQWATSTDNTFFTDIASATGSAYTTPVVTATKYYRVNIKNGAGVFCLNSISDTVQVLDPVVSGTTDGVRCGPGSVILSASGSDGTLKWYATSSGGTALGSGTIFTTPSISSTTAYYVSTESAGITCKSARTAVTATINPLPVPGISPSPGPIDICEGQLVTFTGSGGNYQWRNSTGHISGATGSSFTTGTTEDYRVIVTNASTGCKDSSAIVRVNVNPVPTVSIAPSDPRSICADSSQKYSSTVTGSDLTYQWFNSGTAIPGATADSFIATMAGTYTLRVYLSSCSDTSNEAVLNIYPSPPSSFTETGVTDAICMGDSLELTAIMVSAGSVYQWMFNGSDIAGAYNRKYYAKTGGYYSVRIRDVNNCRKESDAQLIINTPMGIPNLSPKDILFCEGNKIMLYSNAGFYAASYKWTKDGGPLPDTTVNITTGVSGSYDVTATDRYGCVATSDKVTITVQPLPVKPVIIRTGATLSTSTPYATYQWYRNGKKMVGETKRTYPIAFEGNYHVVVSNSSECYNTSDSVTIENLAVGNISTEEIEINVYPNPSQSVIHIDAPLEVDLRVMDLQGRTITEVNRAKQVDMSSYTDGLYIFTLTDKEGRVLKMDKVIKRTE